MSHGRPPASFSAAIAALGFYMAMTGNPALAEYAGRHYYIERPRLAVDLSYRMESDNRQGPFTAATNETQTLNERFDIETGGFVYHPALMTYTFRLSPEWQQALDAPDTGSSQSSDSFLLGYALDMDFLESKPYSVNVFARKQRATLTTSLAATSETESDTYGATLRLKYKLLPSTLTLVHSTSEQSGFYDSQETRDEARLNMRHARPRNDTTFNASWVSWERATLGATVNTENVSGSLHNLYRIAADNRILLNSGLVFRQSESDMFNSSGFTLSETLNWRHSKNFSTNYSLIHSRDTVEANTVDRTSISTGLSHSLYENLITSASANASTSSAGDSNYGGNLNFSYSRRIPWGMIYASLGQDYSVTRPGEGSLQASSSFVLLPGESALLENQNVDLSRILVTDADGAPLFLGIQYAIEVIGTSVRIVNLTPGPDPLRISVTYFYLSPTFDSSAYGQTYGIGFYLWSAWRINYRYSHSQQDFISGIPPDVLAEDTRHSFDTDLKWKWSTTRFLYEDTDSASGVSISRWRLEENLSFRPLQNASLSVSGYVGQTTLKDLDSEDRFYGFRSDLQWKLNNWSRAKIEALYSDNDGRTNQTRNIGAAASWEWMYGIWKGDAIYRFMQEEDRISDQTRDRHSIFFSVRRLLY